MLTLFHRNNGCIETFSWYFKRNVIFSIPPKQWLYWNIINGIDKIDLTDDSTETMVVLKLVLIINCNLSVRIPPKQWLYWNTKTKPTPLILISDSTETMVVLKQLKYHSGYGDTVFHRNNGCIETLLTSLHCVVSLIPPKQWLYWNLKLSRV